MKPEPYRGARTPLSIMIFGVALGIAAALAFALAPAQSAQPENVNVGITDSATDVGFFIADKKGYFRDAGIAIHMTSFPSAAKMIAPLGSGELDTGGGTVSAGLYNAVDRGVQLRVVADKGSVTDKLEYSTLIVRKDLVDSGRFKTLADLKGMTVAVAAKGSGSESSLHEAMKKGGLKWGEVNVVYMGFPDMLVALRNKGIDAAINNEPTITRAEQAGIAVRGSKTVIYPGQQTAVVLYSEDFAQKRRPVAQQFMNAYIRAVRDYNNALHDGKLAGPNADDIVAILTQYTRIKDPKIYREMTPFAVNPDGRVNVATLKNDYAFFKQRKLISGKVTVDQVIDHSFANEAVKTLGPYKAMN
jgi:NitT/TauT family transport system substrate-binding protein